MVRMRATFAVALIKACGPTRLVCPLNLTHEDDPLSWDARKLLFSKILPPCEGQPADVANGVPQVQRLLD